jgi:hypothetical protein
MHVFSCSTILCALFGKFKQGCLEVVRDSGKHSRPRGYYICPLRSLMREPAAEFVRPFRKPHAVNGQGAPGFCRRWVNSRRFVLEQAGGSLGSTTVAH